MIVVSNATPLISLAKINKLHLLKSMYGTLYIPEAVYEEIALKGKERSGAQEVEKAEWIKREKVQNRLSINILRATLSAGESETLVLASELNGDLVLLDEKPARIMADRIGINKTGTLGILVAAKSGGLISEVKPYVDELIAKDFRVSNELYLEILKQAGEI
ncbi:MAG: DUF3368 domain-containing protein [bacterium]